MMQPTLTTQLARGGILAGAMAAFARLGFAATRVEDILAAAGVARRTFYKYFTSKEDVLSAVYDVATGELLRAVRSADSKDGDPLAAIRKGLDIYLDYHVDNAALLRILVEHAIRSDSPLAAARRRFRGELVKLIGDAVREKHDPLLYVALISALEGVSLELLTTGTSAREVERAKRAMHIVLERVLCAR